MAKRYAIVPESWLSRLKNPPVQQQTEQTPTVEQPNITVVEEMEEKNRFEGVIELLPKAQRTKARILLHYLAPVVKLDVHQRILYQPYGKVGSNLLDLVRYFTSPSYFKVPRPLDAEDFSKLIKQVGVPEAALGYGRCENETKINWITLD
jgi:hypothetical protein